MLYQKIHCGKPIVVEIPLRFGCLGILEEGKSNLFDGGIGLPLATGQCRGDTPGNRTAEVLPPCDLKPGVGFFRLWTTPASQIVCLGDILSQFLFVLSNINS